MSIQENGAGLAGQSRVYQAWRSQLHGRGFAHRDDIDLSEIIAELAHISLLAREGDTFRVRLAGTGVRRTLDREARGLCVRELSEMQGSRAWESAARKTLDLCKPVSGRSTTEDGCVHLWLRLPMSSDGRTVDTVLCHDRFLPCMDGDDLEAAARRADRALRLDVYEPA